MKQLMLVIAISILSISIFACGPAVGRAVGDAQVDVDATLAEMGEPTTEAEKELYAMMKEIDRLHKEERNDLLGALEKSGNIVDNLVGVIDSLGNELDEETLVKIGSVIATGQDVDAFFQGVREQAYQNSAREEEINKLLQNEERASWDRIKFLNEQLDKANAEKAVLSENLAEAEGDLVRADQDEDKWIDSNLNKEEDIQMMSARMDNAEKKFKVVSAILEQVMDEDEDGDDAPSAFEHSAEEAGRYQAAAFFNNCLVDWGVDVKQTTREEMKHCRHQVLEELDNRSAEIVEIEGGEVISKPNYLPTLDRDDVVDVVDAFMHCAQAADAVKIIGPALEGCKMEAKEVHHDAAGSGDNFSDHFVKKVRADDTDARRQRKYIDHQTDDINDSDFNHKVSTLLYGQGRSDGEIKNSLKELLDNAVKDLICDPDGVDAEPCDDYWHDDNDGWGGDHHDDHSVSHRYMMDDDMMDDDDNDERHNKKGHRNINSRQEFDRHIDGDKPKKAEMIKQCVDDGNDHSECVKEFRKQIRDDNQSARKHHDSWNNDEYEDDRKSKHNNRRDQWHHEDDGAGQHSMRHGDGAGKRGHKQMMECMMGDMSGDAQYNADGDFAGRPSFEDAADDCMGDMMNMMEDSYGQQGMGKMKNKMMDMAR